jgi:hypothetical protein
MRKILIPLMLLFTVFEVWSQKNTSEKKNETQIRIENSLKCWIKDEVIELDWNVLMQSNPSVLTSSFIVVDKLTGGQLPYQIIQDKDQKPCQLLVQVSFAPETTKEISIKSGIPEAFKTKTFGRMVPERKDDFAWENDKIAFRMYGPALEATGEISNGIDVWVKSTSEMIVDKWYKLDDYHVDHGEGLDYYKVGPTLGAGGIAPYSGGKLFYSKNWAACKVISTGNLRTVFELSYAPWLLNGKEITETKRITLNAGSHLNQVDVTYKTKNPDTVSVAMGILKRSGKGVAVLNENAGYISYWEPSNMQFGTTGVGLVVTENTGMSVSENQLVVFSNTQNNKLFRYYQGACWDKAGEFVNDQSWEKYLKEFALKLRTPLRISINQ